MGKINRYKFAKRVYPEYVVKDKGTLSILDTIIDSINKGLPISTITYRLEN